MAGRDIESVRAGSVGRPRRLTTDQVIAAAIDIADESGLAGLSMPRLAKRLGVGTMTVYGYVSSKQDLLERIAEHILAGLTISECDTWRESLIVFFVAFRDTALAHPALAGLLATGRVTVSSVFDILETHLRMAQAEGVDREEAIRIFYAGLAYTLGFVLWEIPRTVLQAEGAYAEQWSQVVAQLDPLRYPILTTEPSTRLAATVASPQQFRWGLERIVTAAGT